MFSIGIDLGATKLAVAVVDSKGRILQKAKSPTPRNIEDILEQIKFIINDLASGLKISIKDLKGVGIGAPGPVDYKQQVVVEFPNLSSIANVRMADLLSQKTGLPVKLDNDGNLATLGEKIRGAGANMDHFVCLTIGTGIGSGIFAEGRLLRGHRGTGAEIGHMVINLSGELCKCGNTGCFETYVSGPAVVRAGRQMLDVKEATDISGREINDKIDITSEIVVEGAKRGNDKCRRILEMTGAYLGVGIANIFNILNPQAVIIGGGLGEAAFDLLYEPALTETRRRALKANLAGAEILKAKLGTDAGIIGAASLFS